MTENNPRFPLFVDLNGKLAVVVGCGAVARRRVKVLLSFGARVRLVAPQVDIPQEMEGTLEIYERKFQPEDLNGAFLAVAATNDREVNKLVGELAGQRHIPVSVADAAEECSFYFPAVCMGDGLVAGVVSNGTQHKKTAQAAKKIRKVLRAGDEDENSTCGQPRKPAGGDTK